MPIDTEFKPIEYDKLSKTQKLAIFLITVGPEAASSLLQTFDDYEIEQILSEVTVYQMIDRDVQEKITAEFSNIISESLGSILGGSKFARKALEMAKGDYKAGNIMGRITPGSTSSDMIKEVCDMEPRQIFNLIRDEQPQTIAFVISYLNTEKCVALIEMLNPDLREEVVERIGTMEDTSSEMIRKVISTLKLHVDTKEKPSLASSGGLRYVADILNEMDKEISKALINQLEERNPELGQMVRKKMFSFEDLVRLDLTDLQRVTREIEMSDLVKALKTAQPALQEKIFKSVSKRAAETIKDEMDMLGQIKAREVEAAQDRIIQIVRRLEEEEEISLDGEGDKS